MCTRIGSSILSGMDRCAIRVNRLGACARKVAFYAAAFSVVLAFGGPPVAIWSALPGEEVTPARIWVLFTGVAAMVPVEMGFVERYAWVFGRTDPQATGYPLARPLIELLEAETINPALSGAYREEISLFLWHRGFVDPGSPI